MMCHRCKQEKDGRPWIMADVTSGEVTSYCEDCAPMVIDDYLEARRKRVDASRNN